MAEEVDWVFTPNGSAGHYNRDLAAERIQMLDDTKDEVFVGAASSEDPLIAGLGKQAMAAALKERVQVHITTA